MTVNVNDLIQSYPRTRPPLTSKHEEIYAEEYKKTRGDNKNKPFMSKITSWFNGWMHKKVASHKGPMLEIGAGTLNHLQYEKEIVEYDIVEPFKYLYEDNPLVDKITSIYEDIKDIPESKKYDRIVSIAVLEHLTELPSTLSTAGKLLKDGGVFQAGIPSEGGFLWGLAWRVTTGLAYRLRNKIDYKTVMRHEHINNANEIITLAKHFFENVKIQYFPLPFINLSVYIYIECKNPKSLKPH